MQVNRRGLFSFRVAHFQGERHPGKGAFYPLGPLEITEELHLHCLAPRLDDTVITLNMRQVVKAMLMGGSP